MTSSTSDVWRHFIKADGKKNCTLCDRSYKSTTSNSSLIYHLEHIHGIEVTKQTGSQPQQQSQAQQSRRDGDLLNMFGKRRKLTKVQEKEMYDSIVQFICRDMRPYAVVAGDGFKQIIKVLARKASELNHATCTIQPLWFFESFFHCLLSVVVLLILALSERLFPTSFQHV